MLSCVRGFTLVEMIAVMILIGILAVVALPRLNSVDAFAQLEYRDKIAASLRFAQKSAVAHRRLVCADTAGNQINLSIADAFPANACTLPMPGPNGRTPAAYPRSGGMSLGVLPSSVLFFQPSGIVTSDGAGTTVANFTLSPTDQPAINVFGATGRVE